MPIYPDGRWRPIPETHTQPRIKPRAIILHTAVDAPGPSDLYGWYTSKGCDLESHFFITNDGRVVQYIDTDIRADANRNANGYAISIETEDDGRPDATPWTAKQVAAIIRLCRWLAHTHDIPLTRITSPAGSGVGWHAMWGAPSAWTPAAGKTCPGAPRIRQIIETILPALAGSEEDDMAPPTLATITWPAGQSGPDSRRLIMLADLVTSHSAGEGYVHLAAGWVPDDTEVSVRLVAVDGDQAGGGRYLIDETRRLLNNCREWWHLPHGTEQVAVEVVSSAPGVAVGATVEVVGK